jgi:L-lactate dehydrogenase complex protein LldE
MEVDLFIPCFIDQIYPETGMNMVKILKKLGVKVHYNANQTCCGQFAYNSGHFEEATQMGGKFLKDFPNNRPIVSPSASCPGYIKSYYPKLFFNTSNHNEVKRVNRNLYEFTDFLVNVLNITNLGAKFPHKVTYHDSCAALREYGLKDEPRKLLSKVEGLQLVEMKDTDVCCGFGGTFSVKYRPISIAMGEQKVANALETEAEYIVSTDSSCLMHQEGIIKQNNRNIKTIHIIDILASGW